MIDAQYKEIASRPMRVLSLSQLARESGGSLNSERSYIAPVLYWISAGQGRYSLGSDLHGYTANNAIFLPANVGHAINMSPRCHGSAIFFGEQARLPFPDRPLHLRLQGVQLQSELNGLIEDMRVESDSTNADRDLVLYHRAALTLLWLNRHSDDRALRSGNVTDVLRTLAQPRR